MEFKKVTFLVLLKYLVSLCVVLSMLFPIAVQALDVISDSVHGVQVMTLDQQEEQQEDNTEDKKIETRVLSPNDHLISCLTKNFASSRLEAESDFILEIPIPPPELLI